MIWIATNGLISEKIKRITESLLRTSAPFKLGVTISLDGTRGEHDYQRGIVGSYYNALQTLNALSKLRSQYANLLVSIGMTLTPLNQYSVAHVKSIAEHFNVAFSLRPVNSSEFYYRNSIERTKFDKKALHDSIKLVEKHYLKSEGPLSVITKLRYLEGVERFTEGDEIKLPCSAGSKSFFLDPYGTIYPCIVMDEPLGNIRQSRFSELWSSDHAKDIRLKIKKGQCPGCWLECETYRDISKDRVGLAMTACKVLLKAISM
jgi:MoaA/NifB/PqqE/SkfB family radical SAM enzyme